MGHALPPPSPPPGESTGSPDRGGPRRRSRPPRAPGAYLRLALWQRLALSLLIAAALLTAMVLFVQSHNTNSPLLTNPAAALTANREAEILVEQDQAPRSVRLGAGQPPASALGRAIRERIASQITGGAVAEPLERAHCRRSGPIRGPREAFSCSITAGSVSYPFLGVVDIGGRQITFCKVDPPPAPGDVVPVSPRCRA